MSTSSSTTDLVLQVRLFGSLQITVAGEPVEGLENEKAKWILALLALNIGKKILRSSLAEMLWIGNDANKNIHNAQQSLRQSINRTLRTALNNAGVSSCVIITNDYLLMDIKCETDFAAFNAAVKRQDWDNAIKHYGDGGVLLSDWPESLPPPAEREKSERQLKQILIARANAELSSPNGRLDDALQWAQKAMDIDASSPEACRVLMRATAAVDGGSTAIERIFRRYKEAMEKIGEDQDYTVAALYYNLCQQASRKIQARQTSPEEVAFVFCNVPALPSEVIGRDNDAEKIATLMLFRFHRLITLKGPGGIGKTWLALFVAPRLKACFYHGVWYADLTEVPYSADIVEHVAWKLIPATQKEKFAERLKAVEIQEALCEVLGSSERLIVLNNCEHLRIPCAKLISYILQHCKRVSILATSQQSLQLDGEIIFDVKTLSTPHPFLDLGPRPDPSALKKEFPALFLFEQMVQRKRSSFTLDSNNIHAVALLSARLDGLPLALLFAAPYVALYGVDWLLEHLNTDGRFAVLARGNRDASEQQQTLLNSMDFSYNLLAETDGTRIFFTILSVFAGGFTSEAAITVATRFGQTKLQAFNNLRLLQEVSLVDYDPDTNRFRLMETPREYAAKKLQENGSEQEAKRGHFYWFVHQIQDAGPDFGEGQSARLQLLAAEHTNLSVALEWGLTQDATTVRHGLDLATNLWTHWNINNRWKEGQRWLEKYASRVQNLATDPDNDTASALSAAWNGAGLLATQRNDFHAAVSALLQSYSLAKCLGPKQEGDALGTLTYLTQKVSHYQPQIDLPIPPDVAHLLRPQIVLEKYQEAMQKQPEHRKAAEVAQFWPMYGIGNDAMNDQDHEIATHWFKKCLALARKVQDQSLIPTALGCLADVYCQIGNRKEALVYLRDSLKQRQHIEDFGSMALSLERMAGIALACDAWDAVLCWYEVARRARDFSETNEYHYDNEIHMAEFQLGSTRAEEIRREIAALTARELLNYSPELLPVEL